MKAALKLRLFVIVILLMSVASAVSAHTITGTLTASDAVDVYNFQCFTDTPPLFDSVSSSPAHHVRFNLDSGAVRVRLGHVASTPFGHTPALPGQNWSGSLTDATAGNTSLTLTPPAGNTAGTYNDKGYNIVVSKTTSTTATAYSVTVDCEDFANARTGIGALWTDSQTPTADFSTVIDNP